MNVRALALSAIITALYAAITIVLGALSYGPIQCRISDCLIPTSAVLGWPAVVGVTLGCVIANFYYQLGLIDVVFGSLANLLASTLSLFLRKRLWLACLVPAFVVGFIVGGYLWLFFGLPWWFTVVTVTVGSLISISGLGYILCKALQQGLKGARLSPA